ncbi:glycosyltransferase family 2 protein [Sphingomonas sp. S2-65]|uniref:glycosyltransferase family 2 protein n=1 Tax=Sphingomonas sp. S2-65 TaxID=2903960 RepID=UPI001F3323BA|nr:glycosyltransferase family A protein [Sphingomonas sp. S2-65]UYY57070.1 glycosyltransferase family 2 protein [Sphingomonas sp. S2-65]
MTTAVIIPVRNRPALVAQAIRSCQQQTLPVDEIIVVDDASTDDTPEIVERLASADPRVRLIRSQENRGAHNARNCGAAATQAEWLAFLDSDDQWLTAKHQKQAEALGQHPQAVACFTGIRYALPDGVRDEPLNRPSVSYDDLRLMNFLGSTSTAMVRRETFLSIGGFDVTLPSCQDWDLWLRLRERGEFATVAEPLLIYDQSDAGRISKNIYKVLEGHRVIFERTREGMSSTQLRRVDAYHHIRLAQIYLWDFGARRKALAEVAKSLLRRPTRMGAHLLIAGLRALFRA